MKIIFPGNQCFPRCRRLLPRMRDRACATILTVVVIFGCAAPGKRLEAPRVSLTQVKVEHATVFETVMAVTLRLFNTNEKSLTLKGADVSLEVNGRNVAHGISQVEVTLPPYDTTLIPMTLYSSMFDLFQGILRTKDREPLKYRIHGNVRIEGGFLLPSSLPFSQEGELSLDQILKGR